MAPTCNWVQCNQKPKTTRDGVLGEAIATARKWSATDIYHKYTSVAQQSGKKISAINQPVKATCLANTSISRLLANSGQTMWC